MLSVVYGVYAAFRTSTSAADKTVAPRSFNAIMTIKSLTGSIKSVFNRLKVLLTRML